MSLPRLRPGQNSINAREFNEAFDLLRGMARAMGVEARVSVDPGGMVIDVPRAPRALPGGKPLKLHRVRVKLVDGDPGGSAQRCSFVYDLYPYTGELGEQEPLATGVSTVWNRCDEGRYRAAADGTEALAARDPNVPPDDPNSWFLLYVADEVPETALCNAAAPEAT